MLFFFFFNDTATTEIYTLSLHDALPIYRGAHGDPEHLDAEVRGSRSGDADGALGSRPAAELAGVEHQRRSRSEEHTSELQSRQYIVCRLLLEKKKHD